MLWFYAFFSTPLAKIFHCWICIALVTSKTEHFLMLTVFLEMGVNNKRVHSWLLIDFLILKHSPRKEHPGLSCSRNTQLFLKSGPASSGCCFPADLPLLSPVSWHLSGSWPLSPVPLSCLGCAEWSSKARVCAPPHASGVELQIKRLDSGRKAMPVRCNHLWLKPLFQIYNGLININREAYLFSSSPMSLRVDKMLVK